MVGFSTDQCLPSTKNTKEHEKNKKKVTPQPYHNSWLMKEFVTPAKAGVHKKARGFPLSRE
jgi:hypothetical protein